MVIINMCAGTFKIPSCWEELEYDLGSFWTCNVYGFYGMNVLFNAMEMGIYLDVEIMFLSLLVVLLVESNVT